MLVELDRIRKAVLAVASVVLGYVAVALDVLGKSDLSTLDGVYAALFALAVGYGVWRVPNAR